MFHEVGLALKSGLKHECLAYGMQYQEKSKCTFKLD